MTGNRDGTDAPASVDRETLPDIGTAEGAVDDGLPSMPDIPSDPPVPTEWKFRELVPWTPIEGAPAWAQEMDRRNHEERQLLFTDNDLLRREIRRFGRRLSDHDTRIEYLEHEVTELKAENLELRRKLKME